MTHNKSLTFLVDTEELGTKELVFGEKKFYIDAKSNEQGQFMRIVEVSIRSGSIKHALQQQGRTAFINRLIYTRQLFSCNMLLLIAPGDLNCFLVQLLCYIM